MEYQCYMQYKYFIIFRDKFGVPQKAHFMTRLVDKIKSICPIINSNLIPTHIVFCFKC